MTIDRANQVVRIVNRINEIQTILSKLENLSSDHQLWVYDNSRPIFQLEPEKITLIMNEYCAELAELKDRLGEIG